MEQEAFEEVIVPEMNFQLHPIKVEEEQLDCLPHEENVHIEVNEEIAVHTEPFDEVIIPNFEENITKMVTGGPYLIKIEPGETQPDAQSSASTSGDPPEKHGNLSCEQCDIVYRIHPKIVAWHDKYCHGPEQLVKVRKPSFNNIYRLQCVHCPTEVNTFEKIILHLRKQHQLLNITLPFDCDRCDKQFLRRFRLELHQRICKKKRKKIRFKQNQKCIECNIAYAHREMLVWHVEHCHGFDAIVNVIKLADKKYQYECVLCKHENGELYRMLQHLRDQHRLSDFPYKCNFCSKQFLGRNLLSRHEHGCNNTKKTVKSTKEVFKNTGHKSMNIEFKCNQCSSSFIYPEMLAWHVQHCHGDNPVIEVLKRGAKKLRCIQCKEQFSESFHIIKHLINQHQFVNLPFPCDVCDRKFMSKYALKKHKISCKIDVDQQEEVKEEPVHTQKECLPTRQKKILVKRKKVKVLTGKNHPEKRSRAVFKKANCEECDIAFKIHPNLLAWHTTYCHGPEPLVKVIKVSDFRYRCQCLHCRCKFDGFEAILRHLRTKHEFYHMELPFSCDRCPEQFIRKFKLDEHQLMCMKRKKWARTKKNKKCDECTISYGHLNMLKWHITYCHGENPLVNVIQIGEKKYKYRCIECNTECRELHLIIQHLRDQHEFVNFPYKCKLCGKRYIRRHLYKFHEHKCNGEVKERKRYEKRVGVKESTKNGMTCDDCDLNFRCREMFIWHFQHCHGENKIVEILTNDDKKFQCMQCEEKFKVMAMIVQHLRVQHKLESLPYHCNVCKKQFIGRFFLKKHKNKCMFEQAITIQHPVEETIIPDVYTEEPAMEIESVETQEDSILTEQENKIDDTCSDDMNLTCDQCDITYECPEFFTWHTRYCHGDSAMVEIVKQQEPGFQCLQCNTPRYQELKQIILHLRHGHHLVDLPFKCKICGYKQFVVKEKLTQHKLNCKAHLSCDKCSFHTKSKFELTIHMRSHKTSRKSVLLQPKKRPPQQRRITTELKCEQCNISYGYPEILAWHVKHCHGPDAVIRIVKIGRKKFDFHCTICQTKYSTQNKIIQHVRKAHGVSSLPFQCSDCKKFYVQKYLLIQHQYISCKNRKNQESPTPIVYHRTGNDDHGEIFTSEIEVEEHTIKMEIDESQESFQDSDTSGTVVEPALELRECQVVLTKMLQCDACCFYTEYKTVLDSHMQTHRTPASTSVLIKKPQMEIKLRKSPEKKREPRSLYCEECCVQFIYSEVLTWHLEHFHGTDPIAKVIKIDDQNHSFQCCICDSNHYDITMITQHLHVEHGLANLPFSCKKCSKQFLKRYDLIRHRVLCKAVVRPKLSYQIKCDQCRMKFAYSEMLAWHVESFHGPNPTIKVVKMSDNRNHFQCLFCNRKERNIPNIIRHQQNQHKIEKFPFKCDECGKKFLSAHYMKKHPCKKKVTSQQLELQSEQVETIPAESISDVQCTICDELFKTEKQLKNHLLLYHGQMKCDHCDEMFNTSEQLESHCHEIHSELFVPDCSKIKRLKNKGRGVKKTHHFLLKKPVSCRFCSAEFNRKEYLYQHLYNVHTGKFIHCAHCDYNTRRKIHLIRHLRCWHIQG